MRAIPFLPDDQSDGDDGTAVSTVTSAPPAAASLVANQGADPFWNLDRIDDRNGLDGTDDGEMNT